MILGGMEIGHDGFLKSEQCGNFMFSTQLSTMHIKRKGMF